MKYRVYRITYLLHEKLLQEFCSIVEERKKEGGSIRDILKK